MIGSIVKDQPQRIRELRNDVPGELEACIRRMMAKNREDRQEDMVEVIEDLRHAAM